ncbi:MAG: agmatine deiminase [Acidocella sp. 20-57-95]|nr:MAG: agmatine deiminase [Acidocella sp. 20-57-95]HQT64905.1 agmatine deiminase [Acidocella sp.]HQU03839.1 agmatine deiminase [Acidocella sp.]
MSTPREDGFFMPAEWAPHAGTWMIWPERTDNWRLGAKPAQAAFTAVASAIARYEPVTMMVSAKQFSHARRCLPGAVRVVEISSNDAWARDVGASFLVNGQGELRGVDWPFNAWGGVHGGLYFPWDLDDAVAAKMLQLERAKAYRAPAVIEGGAIHVDGEGTVLVTEACLLDENRNPGATRQEIERVLKDYLGASQVIWLGEGVPHDETGGHIDNIACFVRPGVVALSWCDDPADPHYKVSRDAETRLLAARDAKGRSITVVHIPMPSPLFFEAEEAAGIDQTAAGMSRQAGERLAASYINFYFANGAIIAPMFHVETDAAAQRILTDLFPEHDVIMIPAREILLGGGNIHCITQQQPRFG